MRDERYADPFLFNEHDRRIEYNYRVQERLGILTDGRREPTQDEVRIAETEARKICGHIGPALDHERAVNPRTDAHHPYSAQDARASTTSSARVVDGV